MAILCVEQQTLAAVTLWAIVVWLRRRGKCVWIAAVPAVVMTYIVTSYIFISPQFAGLGPVAWSYAGGAAVTVAVAWLGLRRK